MMMIIRPEQPEDAGAIREVHRSAFASDAEARLVDRLREHDQAKVSLVAEVSGSVVGHVLFSPVSIVGQDVRYEGLGLAPLAVHPPHQSRGIGSTLVREGLAACARHGHAFVVVLGHPGYYPRFGFQRASQRGLANEFGTDDAFMILELQPASIPPRGLVRYGPEFGEWICV